MSSLSLELVLNLDLLLKLDPSNSSSLIVDGSSTTLLSDISPSKSVESKSCACLLVNTWRLGRVELLDDSWVGVSIVCLLWKPTFSSKKRYNYNCKMITIENRHFCSKQNFHLDLSPIGNLKSFMSGPPVVKETLVLISTIHRRLAQLWLTISTIHCRLAHNELRINLTSRKTINAAGHWCFCCKIMHPEKDTLWFFLNEKLGSQTKTQKVLFCESGSFSSCK